MSRLRAEPRRAPRRVLLLAILLAGGAAGEEWTHYGATAGGTKYAPLDHIHRGNVAELDVAWVYRTGALARHGEAFAARQSFENTPILADDSLIVCTPLARVIALDPTTGAEQWQFDPNPPGAGAKAPWPKCRGVAQWRDRGAAHDGECAHRILFGTWDFKAWAIDAHSGRPCRDFGRDGVVVLDPGKALVEEELIQVTSPPAVIGDVAVFGSFVLDGSRHDAPSGKVRALDVRTGAIRWEFDPVPRDPADPATATWGGDSAQVTGHANVWSAMSVDEARDLVFLPTTSPSPDFFGGLRPGENRYANSLVALRGTTGELVWHFQITHHDLWDYDLPAQPVLIELGRDGTRVPAVVQLTKQGLVFVFHRETGEPLFPVEERPVSTAGVADEWVAPTQPFPVAPPPLAAQGLWPEDAWGFTFLDRRACRKRIARRRHGAVYTPPSLQGTVVMPSSGGGVNWGGGAWDPERHLLIVPTVNFATVARLVPRAAAAPAPNPAEEVDLDGVVSFPQAGTPYVIESTLLNSPLGAPCTPPPWGRLAAVDLAAGTLRWQVALGTLEKLLPVPLPLALGTPNAGGALVTAGGLAFIAASLDDKFRAFDVDTGRILWETRLPAGGQASPMSYVRGGRQYVIIAAGGHSLYKSTPGDYVIAYALPRPAAE